MRGALGMVLRHHPHVRRVMPSLAVLDRALAMGPHALERVPAAWLKDASVRLDALVGDWSSDGLRQLREYLRSRCKQPAEQKGSTKPPQRPDY